MVEQWCVRIAKEEAEQKRRELVEEGILDKNLRPGKEGDWILFPVTRVPDPAIVGEFEARPLNEALPRHELIGGIAVLQERDPLEAGRLLASRPSIHTVLVPESDVEGEFRTRRFEVMAGVPTTMTRYQENGLLFDIDLSEAYFSARLSTERQRVLACTGPGERVLDMFAGVGPFAITLAGRAGFVAASDINPGAVRLLLRNISLNRARNVLPLLCDASHLPRLLPWKFDRVVMNLPLGAVRFLPVAVEMCRPGGTIHCYALQEKEGEFLPDIRRFPVAGVSERIVRSYSPGRWHAVYDIRME